MRTLSSCHGVWIQHCLDVFLFIIDWSVNCEGSRTHLNDGFFYELDKKEVLTGVLSDCCHTHGPAIISWPEIFFLLPYLASVFQVSLGLLLLTLSHLGSRAALKSDLSD